ncbi:MAG: hypothetical protein AB1782_10785 [Cyanobacteriota bacterium]
MHVALVSFSILSITALITIAIKQIFSTYDPALLDVGSVAFFFVMIFPLMAYDSYLTILHYYDTTRITSNEAQYILDHIDFEINTFEDADTAFKLKNRLSTYLQKRKCNE